MSNLVYKNKVDTGELKRILEKDEVFAWFQTKCLSLHGKSIEAFYLAGGYVLSKIYGTEYNDIDIAYYKDDAGAVWCFTSDQFDRLRDNKTNPYTNNFLPENTIKHICRLYQNLLSKSIDLNKSGRDDDTIINSENYNARLTNFFIKIESMGCYANMEGYKNSYE